MPTIPVALKKVVQSRSEESAYLHSPGDAVLVERGKPRWFVMRCPCGCGDVLPVNLDPRAGKAWRYYKDRRGISIYPSVWRDTGCESHFIVWRGKILLFGSREEGDDSAPRAEELTTLATAAHQHLSQQRFRHFAEIADALDAVPWDVLDALRHLVRKGLAREGAFKERGTFVRTA